jgi:hypothetical protein
VAEDDKGLLAAVWWILEEVADFEPSGVDYALLEEANECGCDAELLLALHALGKVAPHLAIETTLVMLTGTLRPRLLCQSDMFECH